MDGRRLEIEENAAEWGLVSMATRKPVGVVGLSNGHGAFVQARRGLVTMLRFRDFQVHGASRSCCSIAGAQERTKCLT